MEGQKKLLKAEPYIKHGRIHSLYGSSPCDSLKVQAMERCGDLSGFGSSPTVGQVLADSEGAQVMYVDDLDVDVVSPG